ncbi:MAG: hypothetical protein ABIA76_05925, partial [Candidatus Diapherotrites archaeon]
MGKQFVSACRGFTLFTALVSFILIVLGIIMVNSMIQTESTATKIIDDLEEQQELQAIADLSRADALQTFNYSVRQQLERYFTDQQNVYFLNKDTDDWEEIQTSFVEQFFVSSGTITPQGQNSPRVEGFAAALASSLASTMLDADDPRGYSITIKNVKNTDELKKAIQAAFEKSANQGNFLQLIECDSGEFDSCNGSFYINLDLTGISAELYEAFPFVSVKSETTNRTLEQPILPRGNIQLYVPIRYFKALAGAKQLRDEIIGDTSAINQMKQMKLGFCDTGCNPRDNPNNPKTGDWTNECPTSEQHVNNSVRLENPYDSFGAYEPISSPSAEK